MAGTAAAGRAWGLAPEVLLSRPLWRVSSSILSSTARRNNLSSSEMAESWEDHAAPSGGGLSQWVLQKDKSQIHRKLLMNIFIAIDARKNQTATLSSKNRWCCNCALNSIEDVNFCLTAPGNISGAASAPL